MFALPTLLAIVHRSGASEEAGLMSRVGRKDEKAFGALYDLYSKLVYSLIMSVVRKQDEAEDILQEIFLQVWEKASTFDAERGNVYAWLVTLARNRAIDRIRSKGYRNQRQEIADPEIEMMSNPTEHNALDSLVIQERAEIVKRALQKIPAEQRKVIQIAYFGGASQSEIALRLHLPLGTVKTRIRQGMKKLQMLLRERS